VVPGGAASVSNLVFEGDVIEAVNGIELQGMTHERVIELLVAKEEVALELVADESPMPDPDLQMNAALELQDIRVVTLQRGTRGLGMKVSHPEGSDTGAVITNLVPGSAAFESGEVFLNDVIVEVDGLNVLDMPHGDILVMLTTRATVTLTLSSDLSLLGMEAVDRRVVRLQRDPSLGLGIKVVTDELAGIARVSGLVDRSPAALSGQVLFYRTRESDRGRESVCMCVCARTRVCVGMVWSRLVCGARASPLLCRCLLETLSKWSTTTSWPIAATTMSSRRSHVRICCFSRFRFALPSGGVRAPGQCGNG
jgi:hypothetical protein